MVGGGGFEDRVRDLLEAVNQLGAARANCRSGR
jgi:hypothetical protein